MYLREVRDGHACPGALVTQRGFHRGRDLLAALEAALREFRG